MRSALAQPFAASPTRSTADSVFHTSTAADHHESGTILFCCDVAGDVHTVQHSGTDGSGMATTAALFAPGASTELVRLHICIFFIYTFLSNTYLHNSPCFLIGFNVAKVLLLAAMCRLVLTGPRTRRVLAAAVVVALGIVVASFALDTARTVTVSRVVQCVLLAGFALVYLEQELNRGSNHKFSYNPIWLLSLGRLI